MRTNLILAIALMALQLSPGQSFGMQDPPAKRASKKSNKDGTTSKAPSDQEVGNARSEGLVWIDSDKRVYYKQGDLYGRTKHGKFATEDDAKKEGIFEAKQTAEKTTKKRADQSGVDATIDTHSSTPPKQ
jgi:hypothetical protein